MIRKKTKFQMLSRMSCKGHDHAIVIDRAKKQIVLLRIFPKTWWRGERAEVDAAIDLTPMATPDDLIAEMFNQQLDTIPMTEEVNYPRK